MNPPATSPFAAWQNFYVVVGSSAGALTGLQFVVVTLIAQSRSGTSARGLRAFGTPTVIHFCTALLISAFMLTPWHSLWASAPGLGAGGFLGVLYSSSIVWHARKAEYDPDFEDWVWYTALPLFAHLMLVVAAVMLWHNNGLAAYIVAANPVLFLLVGVHNSWDTVTYIALKQANDGENTKS